MNFDDLQKSWQSQAEGFKVSINSSLLLHEVKRNKQYFAVMIFWRDFRECLVSFLLTSFFLWLGITTNSKDSVFLAVTVGWIGIFIIGDRLLQLRKRKQQPDSLRDEIEISLREVSHQVWLLKNVFWWYILPPAIGLIVFFGTMIYSALRSPVPPAGNSLFVWISGILLVILSFWLVYRINQRAVRKELLPRQRELEKLLSSLSEPPANGA